MNGGVDSPVNQANETSKANKKLASLAPILGSAIGMAASVSCEACENSSATSDGYGFKPPPVSPG